MILVLNCGSQSIKWKLFDEKLKLLRNNKVQVFNSQDYESILRKELEELSSEKVDFIGHRVVHGKDVFNSPTEITLENINELEKLSHLAPLHNPYNVLGIKTCLNIFKSVPQIAVFDTEFFKDLPAKAFTYALPESIVKEFGFRRYGFHGISHEYVAKQAAKRIKRPFNKLKIITCHLGGGASISAIKNGKAIDTSMGFTPLQGLVMMTRAGDIDSGVVLELVREFTLDKTNEILNKESGIKGICGESDMLKVLEKAKTGDVKAKLSLDVFTYSVKKYIGSYFAILGGCDVLVFTGTIGAGTPDNREDSEIIRDMVCKDLDILKKTKILAIETDEELAIAEKVLSIN